MKVLSILLLIALPATLLAADARLSVLCKADEVSDGGYWSKQLGSDVYEKGGTALKKQKEVSQWRMDINAETMTALVTRYSGSTKQVESPEVWSLETDPMQTGFIAVPRNRKAGDSPQVITITAKTLDFVYSTHHVNPMYNRASVWVGKCERGIP